MPKPCNPVRYPGNQGLFRALELSILASLVGLPLHVHAEGLRGTGKTTIIRSVRDRLPRIVRIKGCVYNCVPWAPHCPEHRRMGPAEVAAVGTEWVPMPFREISHSAKVGTVAGSIDLARLTDRLLPEAAMLPGTIPQAHRGIIFVDEINRLADTAPELADVLLDVMGTKPGRLQVEETGLPTVEIPVSVSVWAASNPDEDPGPLEDIRKQLSDRFDFVIPMERPSSQAVVREILSGSRERLAALIAAGAPCVDLTRPVGREPGWGDCHEGAGESAGKMAERAADSTRGDYWSALGEVARRVEFPAAVEDLVASLYVDFGLESLRAVEAIHHGSRFNCVIEGRSQVTVADVVAVAPGALQHRLDVSTFARVMEYLSEKLKSEAEAGAGNQAGADFAAGRRLVHEGLKGGPVAGRASGGPGTPGAACAAGDVGGAGDSGIDDAGRGGAGRDGAGRGGAGRDGLESAAISGDHSMGRLGFWSLFGRRSRPGDTLGRGDKRAGYGGGGMSGSTGGSAGGGAAGSNGPSVRRTRPPGSGSGAAAEEDRAVGQGGGSPAGGGATCRSCGSPRPVAPPHEARPLADILREIEATGRLPSGPRPS